MKDFAQELVDETIDHLRFDIAALKACSLVCRCWLPRTRVHIFANGKVVLRNCTSSSFFDIFESYVFPILPEIRCLELQCIDGSPIAKADLSMLATCPQLA
ncbi:hypothetical protein B0H10DRAFT_661057, partial [Mycena sp. CBHHK59/15]